MKRALRIFGICVLAFFLLLVGGSAAVYYLVGFDHLANEAIAKNQPRIEAALGRSIRVGPVQTSFFPTLSVRVPGIAVEGVSPQEPALLDIDEVRVEIALWKAIFTLGKTLEIRDISVREPRLVVLRHADGSLSIEDLLARGEETPEEAPSDPGLLEGLHIDRIRLLDGAVYLLDGARPAQADLAAGALSYVEAIDLVVQGIGKGETLGLDLSLAALAREKNLRVAFQAGPLHTFPPAGLPPLRDLRVQAEGIELHSFGAFLGDAARPLEEARLTANLALPHLAPGRPLSIDGGLALERLRMEGGEAFDLRSTLKAEAALEGGDLVIESLLVDLGGMRLSARGAIYDATTLPRFEDFELRSEDIRLERLLALLPQLGAALPPGARMEGPLQVELRSSGDAAAQRVSARFDLRGADLHLPGMLAKPEDVPLGLFAEVELDQRSARFREVHLRAADLDLQVRGEVSSFDPPTFDLQLAAAPFSFDSMVRLAPSVAESLAASGAQARGQGQLEGRLKSSASKLDADLRAALRDASLSVPQAEVKGDVRLSARFGGDPATTWEAALRLDAGDARLFVPELVDKAPSTPLHAKLEVRRGVDRLELPTFDLRLGELRLDAEGAVDLRGGGSSLVFTLPRADLPRLRSTFLFLPEAWASAGHLEGALRVEGDPQRPGSLALTVPSLSGRIGRSDFRLTASVRNLEAPVIEADLRSSYLDLDALLGSDEGEEAAPAEPREDTPALRAIEATTELRVDRARFTGRELSELRARVLLRDGKLLLEEARFDLYGGRVSAAGTEAEIWKGKLPYDVRLSVSAIDVQAAIAGETAGRSPLAGRGDLELRAQGLGTEREDFERNLHGLWSLTMTQGRLVGPDLSGSALGALASIPAFAGRSLPTERELRDLVSAFEIENGEMKLVEPMRFRLGRSAITLGGGVGIFGDLRLEGHYQAPASLIASLSGGRCRSDTPVDIPLSITGSPASPRVRAEGEAVALTLGERCLAGRAEAAAEELLGKEAVDQARALEETAKEEAARARAEAEEAAARARAAAEAKKRQLERKAQEAKKAAERKAQDAAKKAAEEARKRLGF